MLNVLIHRVEHGYGHNWRSNNRKVCIGQAWQLKLFSDTKFFTILLPWGNYIGHSEVLEQIVQWKKWKLKRHSRINQNNRANHLHSYAIEWAILRRTENKHLWTVREYKCQTGVWFAPYFMINSVIGSYVLNELNILKYRMRRG